MHADYVGSVLPEKSDHWVGGGSQKLDNVVIERIHVLHEPLLTVVLHLRGKEGWGKSVNKREGGSKGTDLESV